MPGKKKIASIVLNSVSSDARVLREAESLQKSGYEVVVYGLKLKPEQKKEEVLSSGVRIKRADYYGDKRLIFLCALATCAFSVCFFAGILHYFSDISFLAALLFSCVAVIFSSFVLAFTVFDFIGEHLRLLLMESRNISHLKIALKWFFVELIYRKSFVGEVLKFKPDFLHAHDLSALPVTTYIKGLLSVPLIYDSHEIFEEMRDKTNYEQQVYRVLQEKLSSTVDGFITINESIGEFLRERYPKLPNVTIVKNASVYESSILKNQYDGRLHHASNFSKDRKIILYQGGFGEGRGLEGLVQSSRLFPESWGLVLMGWGPLEERLGRIANEINRDLKRVVIIPGVSQQELPFWTQGASLGVIPYVNNCLNHFYCSPNKLWEYPRSGVPIVASAFPELKKTIEKARMGWLINDFEKEDQLSILLRSLNPDDLRLARENAIKFIEKDNWQKYEKDLIEVYLKLER